MKLIRCPLNGPRNVAEFICRGPVKPRPAADADEAQWAHYLFLEENPAGPQFEWWMHVPTAFWFIAERDTLTGEIVRTFKTEEFFSAQPGRDA